MTRKMSMKKKMKMVTKDMTAISSYTISRKWTRASNKIRLTWKEKMKRMRTTTTSTRFETSTLPLTL
jgi:hypothetical protein